ncbi:MAG: aminoacyl-tRNA hydrolase [Candidatus Levybacteria bacterium]|nr:aminoacyl-tRNA hydrolase [Candidatus Levybacteria bacterium]
MKLIVGLGNPGEKYIDTRHNMGFMVLERFLKDLEPVEKTSWDESKKFKADFLDFEWKPKGKALERVLLLKPKTFMNNSGLSVSLVASYYHIDPKDIWIVHDELDLPIGMMKIRFGGSAAGHHGIESVMEKLGTEKFWRFRMGIGESKNHSEIAKHKVTDTQNYVLSSFGQGEYGKVRQLIKRGSKALEMALEKDLQTAMNRFNTK